MEIKMDLSKGFKIGDRIIHILDGQIYIVKYVFSHFIVVNGAIYDFPIHVNSVVPHSLLMEELL